MYQHILPHFLSHATSSFPTEAELVFFELFQCPSNIHTKFSSLQVTADHLVRPIMVPRDVNVLPWNSGYAEAINAGKSLRNEDQAAFHRGVLRACDLPAEVESELDSSKTVDIPYVYFGTFDGHAGSGCAVAAANELHVVLHRDVLCLI